MTHSPREKQISGLGCLFEWDCSTQAIIFLSLYSTSSNLIVLSLEFELSRRVIITTNYAHTRKVNIFCSCFHLQSSTQVEFQTAGDTNFECFLFRQLFRSVLISFDDVDENLHQTMVSEAILLSSHIANRSSKSI